jgi:hypothetical protein
VQALDLAVVPLDAARRTTLRLATRSALLTRLFARRDSRIACLASLQITLLFALALYAPVALFFVGPVLFGVVHLAADVRYLVVRRAPPRALLLASAAFALAITAVEVGLRLRLVHARSADPIEVGLGLGWIGFAFALSAGERIRSVRSAIDSKGENAGVRHARRPVAVLAVSTALFAAAWFFVAHARAFGVALIHLHNFVAIAAWLLLFRRPGRAGWTFVPLALVVGFSAVLLSGAGLPWTFAHGGLAAFGTHAERLGAWLAPGARPELGVAVVATFVFLQGVHYAAWTGWIPQDDWRPEGTPTYRMTVRNLRKDFGSVGLTLIMIAAVTFVGLAVWNMNESVGWYMTLAKSHAWFEGAFLAYFLLRPVPAS